MYSTILAIVYFHLAQVSVAVALAARSGAIARCVVLTRVAFLWVWNPGHASPGAMARRPLVVGRRACYAVHQSCDVRILARATYRALRLACGRLVLALRTVRAAGSACVGLYFPSRTADAGCLLSARRVLADGAVDTRTHASAASVLATAWGQQTQVLEWRA